MAPLASCLEVVGKGLTGKGVKDYKKRNRASPHLYSMHLGASA